MLADLDEANPHLGAQERAQLRARSTGDFLRRVVGHLNAEPWPFSEHRTQGYWEPKEWCPSLPRNKRPPKYGAVHKAAAPSRPLTTGSQGSADRWWANTVVGPGAARLGFFSAAPVTRTAPTSYCQSRRRSA